MFDMYVVTLQNCSNLHTSHTHPRHITEANPTIAIGSDTHLIKVRLSYIHLILVRLSRS
jgi:hypothetical protein